MFGKKLIIGLALTVVAMAMAPLALANNGPVDDWFRDAKPAPQASIGLIDVTAQDVSRPLATSIVASRLVDDWFRDAKPAPQASIGLIDVTAQDVSRPLTTSAAAAPMSASSTTGFAWGEFGIGAAAMLGAVLLLIGLGAVAMRHRGGQLTTS